MLKTLLRLVAAQGAAEVGALSRALGVSTAQVAHMLETLERQGYLDRIAAGCDQPCAGCPLRQACARATRARLWMLTAHGGRLIGLASPEPAARICPAAEGALDAD
jgi:DNA-binding Lrp family transcriptional regulator